MKNNMNKIYLIGGIVLSVFMSVLIIIGSYKDKQKEAEASETIAEEVPADPNACVAKFEEEAKETLDLYDGIKYSVNQWTVTVVVDLDKWNATSEEGRKAVMNEIYALLNVDAKTSGILADHEVSVTFMTSDMNNVTVYRIEKE